MTKFWKAMLIAVACVLICSTMPADPVAGSLEASEKQLSALFSRMAATTADDAKRIVNDSIIMLFGETLAMTGSFEYPFTQITKAGKISSEDGKVRIYTWNVPWTDGTNTYFGYLQYKTEDKQIRQVFLNDKSSEIQSPEQATLTPDQWMGMLIYEIVETKAGDDKYYTLLGLDNENLFLARKVADVLYFGMAGNPQFGKPIFHYLNKWQNRVIFEYSARAKMSLRWNKKMKMIVFDHLAPANSSYTGNHAYYGPDFSYDGLKFENGKWELVEKIDVRE